MLVDGGASGMPALSPPTATARSCCDIPDAHSRSSVSTSDSAYRRLATCTSSAASSAVRRSRYAVASRLSISASGPPRSPSAASETRVSRVRTTASLCRVSSSSSALIDWLITVETTLLIAFASNGGAAGSQAIAVVSFSPVGTT